MALSPGQIVATLTPIVGRVGAAGIAGNLMQESSDNPADQGGGLAQWQGPRYGGLVKYAQSRGLPATSAQAALGYLTQDLKGPYASLANQLRGAKNPGEAATLFSNIYERPGDPMLANRINYAQQALGSKGGGLPTSPGVPGLGTGLSTTKVLNGPAFAAAKARAVAGQYISATSGLDPFSLGGPKTGISTAGATNPLLTSGELTTKTPSASAYTKTVSTALPYSAAHQTLQNLAGNVRIDQHPQAVVEKLLTLAQAAVGGPYSQANHASAIDWSNPSVLKSKGTDCSGFVSWLMGPDGLNIWHSALATPQIATAPGIQKGQGQEITIWNNPLPGNSGHVFIDIAGHFFQSAGGVGIQPISAAGARSMITDGDNGAQYYPLHPKGL